jgi:hypothetical protein
MHLDLKISQRLVLNTYGTSCNNESEIIFRTDNISFPPDSRYHLPDIEWVDSMTYMPTEAHT